MENIERTQFMVLTGHLDDQPLPDLVRMLRVQRKSGRLQVEYPNAPGSFFFEDGQLVDAQLGSLRGLEALYAALVLDGASFNFNPLVRPPERSIDRQQQKFINELVENPRRENLADIRVAGGTYPAALTASPPPPSPRPHHHAPLQLAPVPAEMLAPLEERLTAVEAAIDATSRRFSRERLVYAVVISFLVGLTVVTALQALLTLRKPLALTTGATVSSQKLDAPNITTTTAAGGEAARAGSVAPVKNEAEGIAATERESVAAAAVSQASGATRKAKPSATTKQQQQSSRPDPTAAKEARRNAGDSSTSGGYLIHVLLEVKQGEVTDARVLNPRPGARAHDSQALKTARARRYPNTFTGSDTVMVRVKL